MRLSIQRFLMGMVLCCLPNQFIVADTDQSKQLEVTGTISGKGKITFIGSSGLNKFNDNLKMGSREIITVNVSSQGMRADLSLKSQYNGRMRNETSRQSNPNYVEYLTIAQVRKSLSANPTSNINLRNGEYQGITTLFPGYSLDLNLHFIIIDLGNNEGGTYRDYLTFKMTEV